MLEAAKRCSLARPRLSKWNGLSPEGGRNKLWGDIFLHVLGIFTSRSGQIFVEKEQNLQTWKTTAVAKFISMNLTS